MKINVLLFFAEYIFLQPNREKFLNGNNLAQNTVVCVCVCVWVWVCGVGVGERERESKFIS